VLLNDVEIVQQPVTCRTDIETALGAVVQLLIDAVENSLCVLESEQQRTGAALLLRGEQVVSARDRARPFAQALETKYFATDWTNKLFAGTVSRPAKQAT